MHEFFLERDYPPATDLARVAQVLTEDYLMPEPLARRLQMDLPTFQKAIEKLIAQGAATVDLAGNVRRLGDVRVVAFEEGLVDAAVYKGVKQDRSGRQAVAAGAADLLVEGLDRRGQGEVDDGAYVRLVDTHSEGDGGDDDIQLACLELALDALANLGCESSVVSGGGKLAAEFAGEFLGHAARWGVDDGGPACLVG